MSSSNRAMPPPLSRVGSWTGMREGWGSRPSFPGENADVAFPHVSCCRPCLDAANEQHYEVSTDFYLIVLGPRLKYSSGLWPKSDTTFEESELAMLELYCTRAQLEDGMKVRIAAPLGEEDLLALLPHE